MGTQTKTLAEQVADGIMNLIQETPYKAGDKLPTEKELCESTGAGRNTVREALKILASRNVLEIRQGAGTFVSEKQGIPDDPLGFSMVNDHVKLTKDLLQVRIMLEPQIAALAAQCAKEHEIKADFPLTTQNLDTGFRVYRLDESNYEKVSISPKEYKQDQLDLFANNIKADRTDLDLLYGSMLAWGVRLDLPLQTEIVDGCTIYTVNEGDLVACFSEGITDKVVAAMAGKSPLRVLFRDACFKEDAQKINIYEQFKQALDWADNDAFNNIRVI